jgi:hypothetical protein
MKGDDPMTPYEEALRKVQFLEDMDRKLAALPLAQQTLVVFYARGLRDGLQLREEPTLSRAVDKNV